VVSATAASVAVERPPAAAPALPTFRWRVWSLLVPALFAWLAVEDQIRKSLDNPIAVFFVKDLLTLAIVVPCLAPARLRAVGRVVPRWLVGLIGWGFVLYLLGSLNPGIENALVPLVGIKLTFSYVPLLIAGARFGVEGGDVRTLSRVLLAISGLVAGAGIYQALVDPTFLNPEAAGGLEGAQLRMERGGIQYVTSTFLSPARYVMFLFFGAGAGMLLYLTDRTPPARALGLGGLGLASLALVTSGARLGVAGLALILPLAGGLLWLGQRRTGALSGRGRGQRATPGQALTLVLLVAGAVALASYFLPPVADALQFYWESLFALRAEGTLSRLQTHLELANPDLRTWIFGHGTGTASFGIGYVGEDLNYSVEGGYGAMIWELGGIGLLFYLLLAAAITAIFVRPPAFDPARPPTALAPAYGSIVLFSLWYVNILAPVLQQYVVAVFLWFFTGMALAERAPRHGAARRP
jgi:hypothetical protein